MRGPVHDAMPPILSYHKIDTRFELGFTQLEPRVFRRQVETLAQLGFRSLGSAELLRGDSEGPAPGSRPSVVITFDDGYESLAQHAFPVLADHGFTALVFVISDFVGGENTWDVQYGWRRFRHLSWDDLGGWQERGIEVHSHTATHARLTWLSDQAVADELGRSRETIASRLGRPPAGLSYPFGAADARVRRLAVEAGYTLGFRGPNGADGDPLMLERWPVYAWDRFGVPLVLRDGAAGRAGRGLARFTNRCAVGTAVIQRALGRRYR
ncbi:MAG: polysaccharide deacetylase family protein [Gemmatimonadales bacterium]|nr:polysaccharide deacetylase family protein [Gemmatimonadales bacterium]